MTNKNLLRILFVEDLPSDVDLAVRELRKEKLKFEHTTVCTQADLVKALKEFKPDLIISDYMMPAFNGLQALKEVKEFNPEIPFILCTGSINEETAIGCLKAGADDYIIKEHLTRLPFAVKEAIEQHMIQVEKKAADLLLKENEEKLQSIFRAAPVGIGLVVDRVFIEVNDTFCKMTGYFRKELIGKKSEMVYASKEEYDNVGIEKYRQIVEKGTGSVETRFKCKDGRILNIFLSSTPLDKDDLTKGVTFTVMDITERIRAEEALQKSQHLFQTLAQVSPVGIFRTDPDGYTTYVNPKWIELSGLSSEEAFGNGWLNAVHPDDRKELTVAWLNNLKSKNESSAEYRFLKPDGSIVWVLGKAVPELIGNEVTGYIGTITDITKRKLVEEELKKNQAQLTNALKVAHLGSWEYDVEKDIFIFNDLFYALFRTTAEQVGGYTMTSADYANRFVHPEDIAVVGLETRKAIDTDDPNFSRQVEHRIIYADGETGYITVRFFVVKNEKGKTVRTYGVNQDITERKRVEVELIKAAGQMKLAKEKAEANDKLKTTFLNNISHEVRTPLNGILGFAEIMSQTGLSEEDKKVSLSMLLDSSDRLLNTITSYMDISLLTSGTMSLYKKDFLPGQMLREKLAKYKIMCSIKNIDLLLKIPEKGEKLSIHSDPEILRKILAHLLNNAIKFTEKGTIDFGYKIHGNEFEFFVKDTGVGIGEESLKSVFEHFIKEDRGQLKITEGSGLGLSISKGLAELLGGKIWVESEKGKGSCFFFTVPSGKELEDHNINPPVSKQKRNKTTNSILVAEDDEANFFYLNALLKQNTSAEIIHASNGKEAVDKFMKNSDIGLILMDIKMPVMDGLEATRQIKAIKRDVPVIAITAYAMAGDENIAIEAGCDGYLTKPINKKLLLEKIVEYIEI